VYNDEMSQTDADGDGRRDRRQNRG